MSRTITRKKIIGWMKDLKWIKDIVMNELMKNETEISKELLIQ